MRGWKQFTTVSLAAALTLSACGSDKTETSDTSDGGSEGGELSGEIFITGSSTVEPISTAIGELFGEERGVIPDVEGPGTGDGFKKFCAGEADIADASRAIKDEEKAACESGGVEFVELKIGLDALTVLTSEKNSDVECLTLDDLYGLVGPESESVKKWSDASTLGATTSLPDADLKIFAPGTESGTYDSFWELAIKKKAEEKLGKDKAEEQKLRPDYGGLANDNEIVDSIASNPTSFGWVGFAFAEKAEGVSEIKIDGGDGCIEPSKETVADGTYPLSRPLFIYVNTAKLAESDALKAFVDYYLSDDGISQVDEVGYVSLDSAALEETRSAWADASK
ncbi:MAG: substrate-binding domain-containing protein [Microthrixaceae bacterium]|nr:substrate-binding domain-containing protein [Microthrixaceae bacterium]HMT24531.1 substrate-binding domain-containing protein [Microthrixaceae bacterium]HMT61721.1 substrate-binding domain-containing protein [Microthrixaceae bacterium]